MAALHHTTGLEVAERLDFRLDSLHSAYVGLDVLAGLANTDSRHVAYLLSVLNDALLQCVEDACPRPQSTGLPLVDD